jgi:glycosyltransferase involved in cell wall biosynthesis
MNILYLHQHFALPSGSTGTRSYEFARRWVKAGHQVTVICGRGDICGLPDASECQVDGIQVKINGSQYSQKQSFFRRIWAFFDFIIGSIVAARQIKDADIIFATSTPLTIAIPAICLSRHHRIPFVFEIRDQWPEVPIQMGIIKNPIVKRLLLWLEKTVYCKSAAVVALSPGMAAGVRSVLGKSEKQILVAPNSADLELFSLGVNGEKIRKKMGWQNKTVILHFGTMGKANSLDFLVEAAERLKNIPQLLFVLMGSGREADLLKQKVAQVGLTNVEFVGRQSKQDLPQWVAACDISTVIFANVPILQDNSANKFFDSLAAGKPVLLNYSGWQREVIERHQAGFGCRQYDIGEYVEKVKMLVSLPKDQLLHMGRNARYLAETCFSRDRLAADVLDLLKTVNAQYQKP